MKNNNGHDIKSFLTTVGALFRSGENPMPTELELNTVINNIQDLLYTASNISHDRCVKVLQARAKVTSAVLPCLCCLPHLCLHLCLLRLLFHLKLFCPLSHLSLFHFLLLFFLLFVVHLLLLFLLFSFPLFLLLLFPFSSTFSSEKLLNLLSLPLTGRLSGTPQLSRVCDSVSGSGSFCQGYRGALLQAKCLSKGGAAEPGQPLCSPLS